MKLAHLENMKKLLLTILHKSAYLSMLSLIFFLHSIFFKNGLLFLEPLEMRAFQFPVNKHLVFVHFTIALFSILLGYLIMTN